jgi:hypothetical protein
VFERLHRVHRGVRGGAEPPARGFGGSAPEFFFFGTTYLWDDIFFRDDIFPRPHDIRWFFGTWFFADGFLFPVKELGFWTNPGHWVRVLDVAGSYMYIVL